MKSKLVLCLFLGLACASELFAQGVEISSGYSFLRERPDFNRHGWVTSVTGNVNSWFGIKAEIGGSYTDVPHHDVHSFLGGAQFNARGTDRFRPWSHFLFGVARVGQGGTITSPLNAFPIVLPKTQSDLVMQPGGGIDFWLRPTWGIRLGADYRRRITGVSTVDRDSFRLQTGLVFKIK
jgi:hypothetical protein